ncbi:MAG: thioredoxin family protein [bacterium]|nr:thioredoxin family protein [bacterium]MCP4799503.1 thioredoxin family protein [bacterium]
MKYLILFLLIATTCFAHQDAPHFIQVDEEIIGEVTLADIDKTILDWSVEAEIWEPDYALVDELSKVDFPVGILCVLGTWCGDSVREVPRFVKLLNVTENPNFKLKMLGVGRKDNELALEWEKQNGFEVGVRAKYGIEFVPTFIFYKDGVEIGRIIESPEVSLESDMIYIIGEAK